MLKESALMMFPIYASNVNLCVVRLMCVTGLLRLTLNLQILFYKIISVCQHVKVLVFPFPLIGTFGLNFDYMLQCASDYDSLKSMLHYTVQVNYVSRVHSLPFLNKTKGYITFSSEELEPFERISDRECSERSLGKTYHPMKI